MKIEQKQKWQSLGLWILSVVLMLFFAAFQRMTGPTYPVKGKVEIGGTTINYKLPRSSNNDQDAQIIVATNTPDVIGHLKYHRLGEQDLEISRRMVYQSGKISGYLPAQPSAGKLQYQIELVYNGKSVVIPDEKVTIRFKNPVPAVYLIPHIILMFVGLVYILRVFIDTIRKHDDYRLALWIGFSMLTVSTFVLGPIVQYFAFGDWWTGWPIGKDLTDNKGAIMILALLLGVILDAISRSKKQFQRARISVMIATLIVFLVFLIPHSLWGSSYNYETGEVVTGNQSID